MKSPRLLTAACFFFLLLAFTTAAQTSKITAAEAKDHVGETRTVCGKVVTPTTRLAQRAADLLKP